MIRRLERTIWFRPDRRDRASARSEIDKALSKYDLYRAVGRSEEALAAMSEAERVDPDHRRVIDFRFAEALGREISMPPGGSRHARRRECGRRRWPALPGPTAGGPRRSAAAVRTLRSAIELVPSSVAIRRYLGQALLVTGQVDEGIESLRRVRGSPGQLRCTRWYVQALDQLGRVEEARPY